MSARSGAGRGRRLRAPEVLQTFAMDCGPAALTCLLRGHGVPVVFDELRAACQTTVDGTSIDDLEAVATERGLDAEQILVPIDYALDPATRCLPALAVTRDPAGPLHFLVLWRRIGPFVEVMDPRRGRHLAWADDVARQLYTHEQVVGAAQWAAFAATRAFAAYTARRARRLGLSKWRDADPAALDGAMRWVEGLGRGGALTRQELDPVVRAMVRTPDAVPRADRFAVAEPPDAEHGEDAGEDAPSEVRLRGAVLLRVHGARPGAAAAERRRIRSEPTISAGGWRHEAPLWALWRMVDDRRAVAVIGWAALLGALATVVEAVLLRGWLDLLYVLGTSGARAGATTALAVFLAATGLLGVPAAALARRAGRRLELRLRAAFLAKLPRLSDGYLASRPASDWAERGHGLHAVRALPEALRAIAVSAMRIGFVVLGIGWLSPWLLPVAALVGALSVALPLAVHRTHLERDLRARTQAGALARFYLDAMLGLVAVRTHGADRTVRDEHEALLTDWARSSLAVHRWVAGTAGLQILVGLGLGASLLALHAGPSGELDAGAGSTLLLVYWALLLPTHGELLAGALRQLPHPTSVAVRLLEPLGAPETPEASVAARAGTAGPAEAAAIRFDGVTVALGGRDVLRDVSFTLAPGEHVAVVGASGAGKSTIVAAILGLAPPRSGAITVDGGPLDAAALAELRRRCAWVDPAVHLWNRSLLANLRYGIPAGAGAPVGDCVEQAELMEVVEQLPDGMRTRLAEGGSRLSGGEGNRVRYARALGRPDVRLVLFDEAFRGLDRWARTSLLARARAQFHGATLVCVTHDLAETATFPRVLVVDGGELVEDGSPAELAAQDGPYRTLLAKEADVARSWWGYKGWRRWWIERGSLREEERPAKAQAGGAS